MRKILLASAAILGGATGAFAQSDAAQQSFQSQGMMGMPWAGGPAVNNNNNAMGIAGPGANAVPKPGQVVIRLNGKVYSEVDASWGTLLSTPAGTLAGQSSPVKLNNVGIAAYLRLYPGIDGMASNGLRYGAAAEIRENFMGGNSANYVASQTQTTGSAASESGVTSAQTLFVRKAFTYVGSDKVGIVRLGTGDGLISLFDYTGVFTTGSWDGGIGNLNNAGVQAVTPNNYLLTWSFLSGNGVEHGSAKVVYLTPQFFGFDFGVEYDPNQGNSFSQSNTNSPYQSGSCAVASANCIGITSGPDNTRWVNRVAVGARYMGSFSGLDVKAYGVYITSGKNSGPTAATTIATASGVLKYDALNEFNGGLAFTYAGFTLNGDFTTGRTNGSNAMVVSGGAPTNAELVALSYANGPWSVGAIGAIVDTQGSNQLAGITQRHEFAFAVGGNYKLAPGLNLALEYQYLQKHQGGFNFLSNGGNIGASGAALTPVGNDIRVQGLTLATIVNW